MAVVLRISRAGRMLQSAAALAAVSSQQTWAQTLQHNAADTSTSSSSVLSAAWDPHAAASWNTWRCFASSRQSGKRGRGQPTRSDSSKRHQVPAAAQQQQGLEQQMEAQQPLQQEQAKAHKQQKVFHEQETAQEPQRSQADAALHSQSQQENNESAAPATADAAASDTAAAKHRKTGQEAEKHDLITAMEESGRDWKFTAEYAHRAAVARLEDSAFLAFGPPNAGVFKLALWHFRQWLARPLRRHAHWLSVEILKHEIETGFDPAEFLDGCKAAAEQVVELYGAQDWKALRGMVSEAALTTMQQRHKEAAQYGMKVNSMQLLAPNASILFTTLWSRSMVSHFDAQRSAEALQPGHVPFWATVGVEITGDVAVQLESINRSRSDESGEDESEDSSSTTIGNWPLSSRSHRRAMWIFARGPLPQSAVSELQSEWWLIGWM